MSPFVANLELSIYTQGTSREHIDTNKRHQAQQHIMGIEQTPIKKILANGHPNVKGPQPLCKML